MPWLFLQPFRLNLRLCLFVSAERRVLSGCLSCVSLPSLRLLFISCLVQQIRLSQGRDIRVLIRKNRDQELCVSRIMYVCVVNGLDKYLLIFLSFFNSFINLLNLIVFYCCSVGKLCLACLNKMPVVGRWAHHGDSINAKNAPRKHVSYCLTLTNKNFCLTPTQTIICLIFSPSDNHLPSFHKQKQPSHKHKLVSRPGYATFLFYRSF